MSIMSKIDVIILVAALTITVPLWTTAYCVGWCISLSRCMFKMGYAYWSWYKQKGKMKQEKSLVKFVKHLGKILEDFQKEYFEAYKEFPEECPLFREDFDWTICFIDFLSQQNLEENKDV